MVAPQARVQAPAVVWGPVARVEAARSRRAVAVAVTAMELLRPESDLARLLGGFAEVDLLVAADDDPVGDAGQVSTLEPVTDDGAERRHDEMRARAAALGLPDLRVHRLGLRPAALPGTEADIVAAMSELVGFDPEPGLHCMAPTPATSDAGRSTVDRAALRIARVYGLPLLRYRCLELAVVVGRAGF